MDPKGDDDTVAAIDTGAEAAAAGMTAGDLIAGRYRITRYLGGGGMGNVYAAVDGELGETLAIKVLRRGLTEAAIERFRQEVRLQRRITHRNVARIFDIGDHAGEKLLTMELVDGESLAARLQRLGAMPLAELRAVAIDILTGLAAAHAAGVVHLDLKPGNVLLARDGRAVIADFGIARAGRTSAPGEIAGTPAYMAPEQHAGAADLDVRTDVYAFGVMLFELATGRRPFEGATPGQYAVAKATPPDPNTTAPALAPALVAVIQRCLAPDRADRPANAGEVMAALERALRDAAGSGSWLIPEGTTPVCGVRATVAVLPVASAADDEYLATGLAEDLADALSRSPGLRVLPATASRGLAATGVAAGAALGADHVVDSSIRRAGDRLRIAVRLVSVRDGFQIWADRRDTDGSDLLSTGDDLAAGLAVALSTVTVERDEIDPRAVDLYLRARHEMRDFWGRPLGVAIAMLEEAARAAPRSPAIVSTLATARVRSWMLLGSEASGVLAREAAEQAIAIGPFHGEARHARGLVRMNTGDMVGGASDIGGAIALAPLLADAHYTAGLILCEIGQYDEGLRRFRHCVELDPARHPLVETDVARIAALRGDWADATGRIDHLIENTATAFPNFARLAGLFKARLAVWRGDTGAALAAVVAPPRNTGMIIDALTESLRAMGSSGAIDAAGWRAVFATSDDPARPLRSRMMSLQILAEVAMASQLPEPALFALERLAAIGLIDVEWLDRCPLWAPFADQPRFAAVIAQTASRAQQVGDAYHAGLVGR